MDKVFGKWLFTSLNLHLFSLDNSILICEWIKINSGMTLLQERNVSSDVFLFIFIAVAF